VSLAIDIDGVELFAAAVGLCVAMRLWSAYFAGYFLPGSQLESKSAYHGRQMH